MNSVYESLRALLRAKELEIKKLEKEIEALRVVLPIVAEASQNTDVVPAVPKQVQEMPPKPKAFVSEPALAMVQSTNTQDRNIPAPDLTPKTRTSWP